MTEPAQKLSAKARRALIIVRDVPGLRPHAFARRYFAKDDPGWTRVCQCGPGGSTKGSGLVMAAGAFLAKLRHRGLVCDGHWPKGYRITPAGVAALRRED